MRGGYQSEWKGKWNGDWASQWAGWRVGESVSGFRWGKRDDEKSSHLVLWDSFSSLAAKLAQLVRVASVQAAVKPRHHAAAPAVILSHLSQAFDSLLCLLSWATCTCLCWMITVKCECVCVCVRVRVCMCLVEESLKGRCSLQINPQLAGMVPTCPSYSRVFQSFGVRNRFIPQVKSTESL